MITPDAARTPLRAGTRRPHAAAAAPRLVLLAACAALGASLAGSLAGCKSDGLEPVGAGPSTTSGTFYQSPTMGTPMPTSGASGVRSDTGARGRR